MNDPSTRAALGLAAIPAAVYLLLLTFRTVRYLRASPAQRRVLRTARRIKRTWRRTARRTALAHREPVRTWEPGSPVRTLIPAIKVRRAAWGVVIEAHTIARIGLKQFQDAAEHLADAWRVPAVRAEQAAPGIVRLRAMLTDPLTTPLTAPATPQPFTLAEPGDTRDLGGQDWRDLVPLHRSVRSWELGVDADATPVTVATSNVSGIVVAGLSGYGKTNLLDARFAALAGSPAVQIAVIDGKGGPDWDRHQPRCFAFAKDNLDQAHAILTRLHALLTRRQHQISARLGATNLWDTNPSRPWPLVVLIIDEAHTFFHESKGSDPESRKRDQQVREITRMVEELIRKGRNVGIQTILATQKATGDAIPTRIRDNCQVAISFAQRTSEAATAILGSDITDHPDAHPRRLQDPAYVGVATLVADGKPGYTLVRTPYAGPAEHMDRLARITAQYVLDPLALLDPEESANNAPIVAGRAAA
ncbi:hypothetical protein KGA66_25470 [Actinocrinis puniceicyclus]|uniref:FtsK domain-containing protein n=1 Tax=Actinocrinis puniceicyclus TaxID=977794 RepID=A0A8J7WTY0_9ACTN|nr:hypothetical protein [Actinocrinis puniceicyclus]MBS2966417.1 hypothetical protein [Actinocrinis puniceicyclus]